MHSRGKIMALIDLEKQITQLQQQLSNSENKEEQKALKIPNS